MKNNAACAAPCATACAATSTQPQRTRKPQRADRMVFHAFNRVYTYKQHASEIAPLMEMQRKMNSARCSLRPAACLLRPGAKYEPALSESPNVQLSVFQNNLCSC